MSVTLSIKSNQAEDDLLQLVKSAIYSEIVRLELALEVAQKRLEPFEKKYKIKSEQFISELSAEDLEGGDEEYVSWAGEFKLKATIGKQALATSRDHV
jgi:hypothetical protein